MGQMERIACLCTNMSTENLVAVSCPQAALLKMQVKTSCIKCSWYKISCFHFVGQKFTLFVLQYSLSAKQLDSSFMSDRNTATDETLNFISALNQKRWHLSPILMEKVQTLSGTSHLAPGPFTNGADFENGRSWFSGAFASNFDGGYYLRNSFLFLRNSFLAPR